MALFLIVIMLNQLKIHISMIKFDRMGRQYLEEKYVRIKDAYKWFDENTGHWEELGVEKWKCFAGMVYPHMRSMTMETNENFLQAYKDRYGNIIIRLKPKS